MSKLRELREQAGMTQKELGSLAGLTDRTVSGLELHTTKPSLETLLRLRRVLGDAVVIGLLNELETTVDLTGPQRPGRPKNEEKER